MFRWLSNLFRSAPKPPPVQQEPAGPVTLRRWESGETNRLNSAHWQNATGREINADLLELQPTLRARCRYEAANNAMVEGVIETHANDIVGPNGPTLQIRSSNEAYNRAGEEIWRKWWEMPDAAGQLSGADFLRLWVRNLWTDGEFLAQLVTDPMWSTAPAEMRGPVSLRLLSLSADRLGDSPMTAGDANVALGIRVDEYVRPTQYYIAKPQRYGAYLNILREYEPVPADAILHGFKIQEAGQVRGVPWLAPCLQPIADLRDYDTQVLDAARQAADFAALMYTERPDAPFVVVNESTDIKRRTISALPPGYKVEQMKPEQPTTGYVDYRAERQRELGRPVNMPLMVVRLGSERHNYSSARMDGQQYDRGNGCIQGWLERIAVNRLVRLVLHEAMLAGALPPAPPDVKYEHTWPKRPHVDPQKEANAMQTLLQIGAIDLQDVCAALGTDIETVIAKRVRTRDLLEAAGLGAAEVGEDTANELAKTIDEKIAEAQEAAEMEAAA